MGSLSHIAALRFCGFARVDLAKLNFQYDASEKHRSTSEGNIKRLVQVFRTEGCKRLEAQNFVKVRVNVQQLEEVLTSQRLTLPQQLPED